MYSAKGLEASAQALMQATQGQCIATPADVRDPDQLVKAVEATIKAFGRIDFVICGAAGNLSVYHPLWLCCCVVS
jgi:peroxisomal 2,4-dienoyl-CoA reductase